ncbi:type II secretion system protein J [Bacillus sp. PS06]|uniref:PulJ/GspJ family protein n=1 Tax=Bacillus sp. PS06 TaxID=2764176 RepID=UPI0017815A5E|nr:prepilin-type N-terminal cleavage/methylation domain-containing protein [Bacillus sp. PS06]MBD8068858.1 prepilin-type N-terminal cleavage/methylation domain-containing protein [Bacillus sp. PS06]
MLSIKKYLSQQAGITLIELLATIAISSMVLGLGYSVLTTTLKYNDKTQSHINLRQEANLIITQMRQQHQARNAICYDQLQTEDDITINVKLNSEALTQGKCWGPIAPQADLPELQVALSLVNTKHNDSYSIDTVLEGKEVNQYSIPLPKESEPPIYEYIYSNNIFVYGSDFGISGSTPVRSNANNEGTQVGAVVINNLNKKDLILGGNNEVSVKNIYIDKKGNNVTFSSSTKLGIKNVTEIVRIDGNVQLNNGGARIDSDVVYIDGNVTFGSSAIIEAKKVIITGNVTFNNWSAAIIAKETYIGGRVTLDQTNAPNMSQSNQKRYNQLNLETIPKMINIKVPSFREDTWYSKNGYQVRTSGKLTNGARIYSRTSFTENDWHENTRNVVIVSKGDITLTNFGGSTLSGILYAPNGRVTFNGQGFTGIIITRDGFFTGMNPSISFAGIDQFITNPDLVPFQ